MFYTLAKLGYFFVAPSNLFWIMILLGLSLTLWTKLRRTGVWLILGGIALVLFCGYSPFANWIAHPLEQRFVRATDHVPVTITDIVVMGGFEEPAVSHSRGQVALTPAAERLALIAGLARQLPSAQIVMTGRSLMSPPHLIENPVVTYLADAGVDRSRITLETKARNSWQNAINIEPLLTPKPRRRVLLVTSAWHMPRSVGVFRAAGYQQIEAWPVDYRTPRTGGMAKVFASLPEGLWFSDIIIKEWLGLFVYWLTGRSSELFPAARRE